MFQSRIRLATALAAGSLLALTACAPVSDPISGVGGDNNPETSTSAEGTPTNTEAPQVDTSGVPATGQETANSQTEQGAATETELVPLAASGPEMVNPTDVPVGGQSVAGFTSEQLQQAYAWAATRTRERYTYSNFWQPPANQAVFSAPAFFPIVSSLTGDAETLVTSSIASADEFNRNIDKLSTLLPPPPDALSTVEWLSPAVADWRLSTPVFTAAPNGGLRVAVPYSAVGVYRQGNTFYSVSIQDVSVYTLGQINGEWRISGWESAPAFGEPQRLPGQPVDRFINNFGSLEQSSEEDLNNIDIEPFLEQYN